MMTILRRGIIKCPGNLQLAIFSAGNIELCCVVRYVVRSYGRWDVLKQRTCQANTVLRLN